MHFVMAIRLYAAFEVCRFLTTPIALVYLRFSVNLTQIYQTATHESEYEHLPILGMSLHLFGLLLIFSPATGVPDMACLRTDFRSIRSTQHGPYFRGYCGEHESEYQGTTQLAGTPLGRLSISFIHVLDSHLL